MNIVEAYIKFNGQLIIIISGLSGSGKSKLAKYICNDFKLKIINQNDYLINKNSNNIENLYNENNIDWNKFNDEINNNKSDGIIIIGLLEVPAVS